MKWSFTIPGQPPSWNASYRIARMRNADKTFHTLVKTPKASQYQADSRLIIAAAKPSKWEPTEQVRIYYRFYLTRDIDADNILKLLNDVIEAATGVDDRRFLPCVISKEVVRKKGDARVEVVIEDLRSPSVGLPIWNTTRTRS